MQNCEVQVQGLKCDADGCGYEDMSISSENYSEYVNAPCPDCGASLLTPEDLAAFESLMLLSEMMNGLPAMGTEEDMVTARVRMNGSGSLEIEL